LTAHPLAAARRRIPKQARARERVERILEAARRELEERPMGEIAIERIAERAGVPVGSVYSYFASKTSLFVAVAERVMGEVDAEIARQLAECGALPWRAAAERTVEAAIGVLRRAPGYRKLLRTIRYTGEFADVTRASNERVAALMATHPAFRAAGIRPAKALEICRTVMTATHALQEGALGAERVDWKGLVDETRRLVTGYLGTYLR
jgi:AcrR family transcriptional regulator